jgi:ATP-binding cassette, subfamily B, bacterial
MRATDMTDPGRPAASMRAARTMLGFAWAADRRLAALTFALLTAQAVVTSLFALWLRLFVNSAAGHRTGITVIAALALAFSIAAAAAADYAADRTRLTLGDKTQLLLDSRLLEFVGRSPTLRIHQTPAHLRELELLRDESWEFSQAVPAIISAVTTTAQIGVTVVLLASVSPLLLLLPAFGLPTLLLSGRTVGLFDRGTRLAAEPSRRALMLYELAADRTAAGELRLFRLGHELLRRFAAEHTAIRQIHVQLNVRAQWARLAGRSVFLVGYLGAIVLVVHRAAVGAASLGDVAMTAVLAGQVLALVVGSAEVTESLLRTLTTSARFLYLERVAEAAGDRRDAVTPVPARLSAGIRLDRVSFSYPGSSAPTLREVTLTLPAGATIAIVGDNGAGKTTLVNLLAGLCHPTSGRILVDGTNLAEFDPEAWRRRISAGFQDHARFEFTVQRAVGLGRLAELDDVAAATAALRRAGASELLADLPAGLQTQLGPSWPEGVELSGGQWQKLAVGRAMMRPDPLLLLLDEPTAAIDAEAEHDLFVRWTLAVSSARERSGGITVLVSHRLSAVAMADLIVVLQAGQVLEIGSHAELMAAGGRYAELFDLQARGYR